jgi:hypothetical protein
MSPSGYSGTPLAKKLGIKNNFRIKLVGQPDHYFKLFSDWPEGVKEVKGNKVKKDFIHYFTKEADKLNADIKGLKNEIEPNGMIWISWPKKAAKIETDVTEDAVRNIALKNGLVDIKVCAVDEIWSGLKLVIRVKDRK